MCSGWGSLLFPEHHIRNCRITGCSKKAYYECLDLRLSHSRPCKGGKVKPNGKVCSAAMGIDEEDICEFCKNSTETYQQRRTGLTTENNQENNQKESDNTVNADEPKDESKTLSLPNDEEMKKLTKEQLITLRNQINTELENRKNNNSQTSNYSVSSQELESKAQKINDFLNKSQVSNNSVSNNPNNDNKVSVGGIIGLVGGFFVLVIGISVLIKKNFLKKIS